MLFAKRLIGIGGGIPYADYKLIFTIPDIVSYVISKWIIAALMVRSLSRP